jgi:hypothetical protein
MYVHTPLGAAGSHTYDLCHSKCVRKSWLPCMVLVQGGWLTGWQYWLHSPQPQKHRAGCKHSQPNGLLTCAVERLVSEIEFLNSTHL